MAHECSFDFAQFDAHSTQFDLSIYSAQTLDVAIGSETAEIASLVQPRRLARGQRIGHESLRRQLRSVQVPACHPVAANVDLSYNIGGHRIQMRIQDVNLRVRDRPTDRYAVLFLASDAAQRGPDCGFGRAIHVPDRATPFYQLHSQLWRQRFAPAENFKIPGSLPSRLNKQP